MPARWPVIHWRPRAALAALNELTPDVYIELAARARRLSALLRDACGTAGITAQFPVVGTLVGVFFGDTVPTNFDEAKNTDEQMYARLFHSMLRHGVALAPGAYEALFVGLGHTDEVLTQLADAANAAARAVIGN